MLNYALRVLSLAMMAASLAGCAAPISEWNKPIRFPGYPWEPFQANEPCPNISGKYRKSERLAQEFPGTLNQDNIQVHREIFKTPSHDKGLADDAYFKGRDIFESTAVMNLHHEKSNLILDVVGGDGILYWRRTIHLDTPMIGCRNGAFVVRERLAFSGAEGSYNSASATEREFSKLPDGSLQMKYLKRIWKHSIWRGLVGQPVVFEKTIIYPAAK